MNSHPIELLKQLDSSTVILTILSLISLSVIYLQHKKILLSPYSLNLNEKKSDKEASSPKNRTKNPGDQPINDSKQKWARCRQCSKLKPIASLKMCSRCKSTKTEEDLSRREHDASLANSTRDNCGKDYHDDLNFYYCDQVCQKLNWKSHKLVCGNFTDLESTSYSSLNASRQPVIPTRSSPLDGCMTWGDCQRMIKEWTDFHRNLLIFTTIQALDLTRYPQNSEDAVMMISLEINEAHPRIIQMISSLELKGPNMIDLTNQDQKVENRTRPTAKKASDNQDSSIHNIFQVAHINPIDSHNFFRANPSTSTFRSQLDEARSSVQAKGGTGVAALFVGHMTVFRFIPIVLPSKADLDAVPRYPNWKELFHNAIKSGISWQAPAQPARATST